jgi:outer membrane lipoprotein-sorting protein
VTTPIESLHPARARKCAATLIAAALTVLTLAATAAAGADWDAAQLFDRLAKERPAHARFHERKYLALLSEPVDSSGELVFTPPDRLEKRTLSPKPEAVIVDGTRVTLERGGRKQTLELNEHPAIGVLIESVRATLTGNLPALTREYLVKLDGDAARWRLVLRPLDASLTRFVERIEIGGAEAQVRTVETFQADGDRSVMTITPTSGR